MPDVLYEGARTDYDDAYEVFNDFGEAVGVATFAVDRDFGGTPTGEVDPLPIRVYVMDTNGEIAGEEGKTLLAYLSLDDTDELIELLRAACDQVRWTRHRRRIEP